MIKPLDITYFDEMYEIMEEAFPLSERRTKEEQKALFDLPYYEVLGLWIDGELSAFLAAWNLGTIRFGEHLATSKTKRNLGLGKQLLQAYEAMSETSIVLEVEPPIEEMAKRRIHFYERLGFQLYAQLPYLQPSFHKELAPLPLHLMVNGDPLSTKEIKEIAALVYRKVYGKQYCEADCQ